MRSAHIPRSRVSTEAIAELASGQYGIVGRRQLLAAGCSARMIDSRLRERRLMPVLGGVYAVGVGPLSKRARWTAAVMAAGPGSLLARASAAELWGFGEALDEVELVRSFNWDTGESQRVAAHPLLRVHRTRNLPDEDRCVYSRIPVTSVARTLLDLASVRSSRSVDRLVGEAGRLGLIDAKDIESVLSRGRGWRGIARLRDSYSRWKPRHARSRSELERMFLRLCDEHRIPPPEVNSCVRGLEVDCLWPGERVIAELDGRAYHGDGISFERDRARDLRLMASGYRVLRFTYRMIDRNPLYVMSTVRQVLGIVD